MGIDRAITCSEQVGLSARFSGYGYNYRVILIVESNVQMLCR